MSSASYAQMMADRKWIEQQVEAEAAFGEYLEAHGVDPAHYIHGVNDEELILPPALKALVLALEARHNG